jgi:hypothetical protein
MGFSPPRPTSSWTLTAWTWTTLDIYLASKLNLFILGSEVNLHGVVRLRPQTNDLPVVSFTGDASLDHFHTVDGQSTAKTCEMEFLRFDGMVANLNPPRLPSAKIDAGHAYARVIVETNRTINLADVLVPAGGGAAGSTNTAAVAVPGPETNAPLQISIGRPSSPTRPWISATVP